MSFQSRPPAAHEGGAQTRKETPVSFVTGQQCLWFSEPACACGPCKRHMSGKTGRRSKKAEVLERGEGVDDAVEVVKSVIAKPRRRSERKEMLYYISE